MLHLFLSETKVIHKYTPLDLNLIVDLILPKGFELSQVYHRIATSAIMNRVVHHEE